MLRTLARRPRRGAGRAMPLIAVALTVLAAVSEFFSPVPARAGTVRQSEAWVLAALNVPAAWAISQGQGVTVAVIDSGVDPTVSDLTGSVVTGPDMTGVGTPISDPNWGVHGTWMGSLIAGHGDGPGDASGIIGVAPASRLLSVRVITDKTDPNYARYEQEPRIRGQRELAEAIRYAVDHGASVISMSLGYATPSRAVRSALQEAFDRNVVVVASAGNSGDAAGAAGTGHAPYSFPADYPGVLGVAAVDATGSPAGFSSENLSVQVAAPGVNVPAEGRGDQYWLVSGTSPACALVAGVAALIKARYRGMSVPEVDNAITTTTTDRPPGGYDEQIGFGTVDAAAALGKAAALAAQPGPPHIVSASSHFGGGPAAVPAPPVQPRGRGGLVLFCLLGVGCLAVVAVTSRLLRSLRSVPAPGAAPQPSGLSDHSAAAGTADPGWSMRHSDQASLASAARPPDLLPDLVPGPDARLLADPVPDARFGNEGLPEVVPDEVVPDEVLPDEVLPDEVLPDSGLPDAGAQDGDLTAADRPDDRLPDQQSLLSRLAWPPAPGGRHATGAEQRGTGPPE